LRIPNVAQLLQYHATISTYRCQRRFLTFLKECALSQDKAENSDGERTTLNDDAPKENPWVEDRLGYAPFAKRLSAAIRALDAPNGYVIGLHGEWGSGKSTALNFVKAFLAKHNEETEQISSKVLVVDFRPWIVSGHQDLIAAFFKVLAEALMPEDSHRRSRIRRLLGAAKAKTDPLIDAVATMAATIDPTWGVASRGIAAVAKTTVNETVNRFLTEPSLQTAYEDLRRSLSAASKRILVIVDDLDRLQRDEVRSIVQMVKTVGRLPNVIYLLAYDRRTVWDALDDPIDERLHDAPRFAEKIIQQEIELPHPSKDSLLSILGSEVNFLSKQARESMRWHYIVRDGIRRWIRRPRDVLRLANSAKFSWSALKGEIDPEDLLAMEGIRLFDPAAFQWIKSNRDFLFAKGRFQMALDEDKTRAINRLKAGLPESSREELLRILASIFPAQSKQFLEKPAGFDEAYVDVRKRRGIGCEAGYDSYFTLHPSSDAIRKSTVDAVVASASDEEQLLSTFEQYIDTKDSRGRSLIGQLFEELRIRYYGRGTNQPTQEMLNALFAVGARVQSLEWKREVLIPSPEDHLGYLITELLRLLGAEEASKFLPTAFKRGSAAFNAEIFVTRAWELGAVPSDTNSSPVVDIECLKSLGSLLLPMIRNEADSGKLNSAPHYGRVIQAWRYLTGDGEEVKAWVHRGIESSGAFLATLCEQFVSYAFESEPRKYTAIEKPDADFYDLEFLLKACEGHLAIGVLDDDQRRRVEAVKLASEKWLADKSSSSSEPSTDTTAQ
jgi:predicted KAP-like P-loop ATPase